MRRPGVGSSYHARVAYGRHNGNVALLVSLNILAALFILAA